MKPLSIPLRVIGPGSQPEEDEPMQYLGMSREVEVFRMPTVPQRAEGEALAEARAVLAEFVEAIGPWDPAVAPHGPRLDLSGVSPAALDIVNQMLGEGEVSIQIAGPRSARIQESVFTGVWRVCEFNADGQLVGDRIEASTLPEAVMRSAWSSAAANPMPVSLPDGAMNSPALLEEIAGAMRSCAPARRPHVINLTLLPLTTEDHRVLELALPVGPVAMISRGFGNCRITSTLARNVWRVQYFNSMNTLILNTLEIVAAPEVAVAAAEDLQDSRERLEDLVAWMGEDDA